MGKIRFPGFYKLSVGGRLKKVYENGWLSKEDLTSLRNGHHLLPLSRADKMIENVVGVMALPMGLGLNFRVNQKDYLVPLVVEEPSIVAALSSAAKIFLAGGGVHSTAEESLLIGQIQVVNPPDAEQAQDRVMFHKSELIDKLNKLHPKMVERGGGVRDIEVRIFEQTDRNPLMLIVHLLVDTCDAMGANTINTMCEEIAADVEAITEGRVFLRILSNLTDRAIVRANVTINTDQLAGKGYAGEEVRDGIILASQFAEIDPYRATTHNKGVMNGIDPLAIATGNDWRAIEAAAHAYAARNGTYSSLTKWRADDTGALVGSIEIPLKVGIKGGSLEANDTTMINYRLLNVSSARELAELMAAVGLAQNFSAIRALSTEGIQKGHMSLHARSVAATAGAPSEHFETVVSRLVDNGDITVTVAKDIIAELVSANRKNEIRSTNSTTASANGKVILLGEHAVVYGKPAIAVPIKNAVLAEVSDSNHKPEIKVPAWDIDGKLEESNTIWWEAIQKVFQQLDVSDRYFMIHVKPNIPAAMGLGGSAAIAVAIIRAVSRHFSLTLTDDAINQLAFQCEKAAHGTPSGIDNTIATFGRPLVYQSGEQKRLDLLEFPKPLNLVIGISDQPSLTVDMVDGVRARWRKNNQLYDALFENFRRVTETGLKASMEGDYKTLGDMMTVNHGLLSAIQVSSPELDRMVQIAMNHGALGAKLTGAGGGGSIVALCDDNADADAVAGGLTRHGFKSVQVTV